MRRSIAHWAQVIASLSAGGLLLWGAWVTLSRGYVLDKMGGRPMPPWPTVAYLTFIGLVAFGYAGVIVFGEDRLKDTYDRLRGYSLVQAFVGFILSGVLIRLALDWPNPALKLGAFETLSLAIGRVLFGCLALLAARFGFIQIVSWARDRGAS